MRKLLLHACCAPCSPHVLRQLKAQYAVTVLFYNPNIDRAGEYELRLAEVRRLCEAEGVELVEGRYDPERFRALIGPASHGGEGGERCSACFRLRLEEACRVAAGRGDQLVATTLTVSPRKRSAQVLRAGQAAAGEGPVEFLMADFKKKDGYRLSCELARQYGFYRQDYCGCSYSEAERDERKKAE